MLTIFQSLANSGRHNSATITDHRKFTTKMTLYENEDDDDVASSLHFTVWINSNSFHWAIYVPYKKGTYPIFRHRPVSHIAYYAKTKTTQFCQWL